MHLTLVPYIAAAGEMKTKPTQHSVKELRSIGIQPDILLCRTEQALPESDRRKIALFTNVAEEAVISRLDVDTIYKLPLWLHAQGLDAIVINRLRLENEVGPADLSDWQAVVEAVSIPTMRSPSRWSASTSTIRMPTNRSAKPCATAACASAPACA